jgi:hypothetical protein
MKFISTKVHTIIGLFVGVVLVFASSIFGFTDNAVAATIPVIVGVFIIINELITTSPYSLVKLVPMKVHIILDVMTGVFLAVSPWLFGFMDSDQSNQWIPHLVVGMLVAGYALLTSTIDDRAKSVIEN